MLKQLVNEFKTFALRGNMIDMAVGIVIGAAFGKIIDSLVKDIIMPPIGLLLGHTDFSNLYLTIKQGAIPGPYPSLEIAKNSGAVTLNIGLFINTLISFTIIAFAIFLVIKAINKMQEKMKAPSEAQTTKTCPFCFTIIDSRSTKCPNCTSEL